RPVVVGSVDDAKDTMMGLAGLAQKLANLFLRTRHLVPPATALVLAARRTLGIGSAGPRAAFRFGLDALERGTDCGLPRGCDPVGPPLPGGSEIGPELAGILQPGRAVVLGEREFLGYVRHWAADKPEGDPV